MKNSIDSHDTILLIDRNPKNEGEKSYYYFDSSKTNAAPSDGVDMNQAYRELEGFSILHEMQKNGYLPGEYTFNGLPGTAHTAEKNAGYHAIHATVSLVAPEKAYKGTPSDEALEAFYKPL